MIDENQQKQIWERDKAHFFHPFTDFEAFRQHGSTQTIVRGEGPYLYDESGKKFLDALSGIQCTNIGLGRKEMADAIASQICELSFVCNFSEVTNMPATNLATRVADLAPGSLNHAFFSTGGSMAVETAFRLIGFYQNIRGKSEKKHILALRNAYHGSTFLTMSIGGKFDERGACDYLDDRIHHLTCPHYYREGNGKSEEEFLDFLASEMRDTIGKIGSDKVAAFFMEPVLGAGGSIVPPKGYHKIASQICKENDVLFVADEVVTGFGRLGHWFASHDLFGIQPDMITSAKGLTSAYLPLGLTLISDEIFETCSAAGEYFNHGFTYSGHPTCCAAALKNIEILEREQLLQNVRDVGSYFETKIQELGNISIVGEVRGMRFMQGVEFVADKKSKDPLPAEIKVADRITDACLKRGLNLRCLPPATVVMTPPLTLTNAEIDFIVETLYDACQEVESDIRNGRV